MGGSSDEPKDEEIIYPSTKLGALTRKKNQIIELMKDRCNYDAVKEQGNVMVEKLKIFDTACKEEMKKRSETEDKNEFKAWYDKHMKANQVFIKKVELWQLQSDSDDEEESFADTSVNHMQLMEKMLQTQALSQLPRNEPDVFSGEDITEYRNFIISFERIIGQRCSQDDDKFYYLMKYTSGEAYGLVKSCHSTDIRSGYKEARELLEKHYGNEYRIAQRYLSKLQNWEALKSEDSNAMRKFAAYLTECGNMMRNMTALNQLNSWRDIREIMMKLPWDLRKQFRSKAQRMMVNNEEVNFGTLVAFVNEQSDLLQLPMLGDITDKNSREQKPRTKQRTFYTNEQETHAKQCHCCQRSNHGLDSCYFFKPKPLQEKEEFVRKLKLCFGCLKSGHRSKDCKSKLTCQICHKTHPTSLHRDNKKNNNQNLSKEKKSENQIDYANYQVKEKPDGTSERSINMLTKGNSRTVCPAIPVTLRYPDTGVTVTTYMGLDNFSTASYMDYGIMKRLRIAGRPTSVKVTTIEKDSSAIDVTVVDGLEICSLDGNVRRIVNNVYAKPNWTFEIDDSPKSSDLKKLPEFGNIPFQFINCKIGILIGMNFPEIIKPLHIKESSKNGPYASKHIFGWALNGPVRGSRSSDACYRTKLQTIEDLDAKFESCFRKDYDDNNENSSYSRDDEQWLKSAERNTVRLPSNQFEIDLPFQGEKTMPNNYFQVLSRFNSLRNRFSKDDKYRKDYSDFIGTMQDRKFVEMIPENEITTEDGKCFYLSHHGVYHKQKRKLRVVFDCSLKYKGVALNDRLWKGPDLNNNLVGVLIRFRLERYAVTADIEKMFYMVSLPKADRNFLRFLWFDEQNPLGDPVQYRMTVHLFGAKSSPAVANFALKKSVQNEINNDVKNIVLDAFYVDDMMKSFENENKASQMVDQIRNSLSNSGFNLTSFSSNSRSILNDLPKDKLSNSLKEINILGEDLPHERALGIRWNPERDTMGFSVKLPEQPSTKRGILSSIFSIYDPLFLASPAVVQAKRLFQITCFLKLAWDQPLPGHLDRVWKRWKEQVVLLNEFEIPRCYKMKMGLPEDVQLHVFADGSEIAYGAVAYLRYESSFEVVTNIVMAKSRLTPLSRNSLKTIPRIELNAAKLAAQLYEKIKSELKSYLTLNSVYFWTDSVSALQYIASDTGRFHKYVANRVAYILNSTTVKQWRFVPGNLNPADIISRGTNDVSKFVNDKSWINGPDFLQKPCDQWPEMNVLPPLEDDCEIKSKKVMATKLQSSNFAETPTEQFIESTATFTKLKFRVAVMLKFITYLQGRLTTKAVTVNDLEAAEDVIWKYEQGKVFTEEIEILKQRKNVKFKHYIKKMNPFIDEAGLLRVGGRLRNSPLPYDSVHPIIISSISYPAKLLVQHLHEKSGHMGREAVLTHVREKYYIVKCSKLVRNVLKRCIICRKVQGLPSNQIMSDLPVDRVTGDAPPFASTATDLFGPFFVSRGRGKVQEKRYGIIFTCLASRAAHIEIAPGLDTSSYINALRRFISRRGRPKLIRSDNGTNLTSSNRELREAISEFNSAPVAKFCQQQQVEWQFQPPFASHHGGVFEREIRTIRKILNSMLKDFTNQVTLTDDLLSTLMCEIENILNSRPLTTVTTDVDDLMPLTPNHLLRLQTEVPLPPGLFADTDLYSKRLWRQAQFLADVFWRRWNREYLILLTERQKWLQRERSHKPGDVVLVVDNLTPRNMWSTGRIVSVDSDPNGFVRSAHIEILRNKYGKQFNFDKTILHRPINKLILLSTVEQMSE